MRKNNKSYVFFAFLALLILFSPVNVYPADEDETSQKKPQEKISLDLKNIDIVELLRIISLKTGKTIVPDSEVTGRMTLYVNNVTFEDVLDIIATSQGLGIEKTGRFYRVMPMNKYIRLFGRTYGADRELKVIKLNYAEPKNVFNAISQMKSGSGKIIADESTGTIFLIDAPKVIEDMEKAIKVVDQPLQTKVFDLNYAKGADVKTQLSAEITQGVGKVSVDERSSKAVVSDLPLKMKKLGQLIRELDEESRQVYIESDIVELTLDDKFERGIDWQKIWYSVPMDNLALAGFFPATLTTAYQKLSVGTLARDHYSIILNFLQTYGKTNVISQPRIAVINNEEANIMVGTRDAYITQTQSQATSTTVTSETVEFIDVGVKLKIVPKIGSDGFITMKIKPEVSSVKETITTALGSRIPIVQTSQSETVVKVKDGMMIMIAGMTKIEITDTVRGWPILSHIPILKLFFSYHLKEDKRTEVIIFITPHLSRGNIGLRGDDVTEILPMEHLPDSLQKKVLKDRAIDKGLYHPTEAKEELQQKEAIELESEEAARMRAEGKARKKEEKTTKKLEKKLSEKKLAAQENAKDYYQRGLLAKADSNNKEAINNFMKAIELDKKYVPAYNSLGIIYEQEGKLAKAEEMYLKAVSIDPHYAPVYSNLALFSETRADYIKALEYWRKRILYGDPNDIWTQQALERVKELEISQKAKLFPD